MPDDVVGRARGAGALAPAACLSRLLLLTATLLILTGGAVRAEEDDDPPHITVRGTASAQAVPDFAVLRVGVSAEDADAGAALKTEAATLAAVTGAAGAAGIAAGDIEAGTTSLAVVAGPSAAAEAGSAAGRARVSRAGGTLRLRLRDPAKVDAVIAALVAKAGAVAGGVTEIRGVDYGLADSEPLLAKLTAAAVGNARRRAEAAAAAAGVKLGPVLRIEPPDEAARTAAPPSLTYSTTLEVTFALNP